MIGFGILWGIAFGELVSYPTRDFIRSTGLVWFKTLHNIAAGNRSCGLVSYKIVLALTLSCSGLLSYRVFHPFGKIVLVVPNILHDNTVNWSCLGLVYLDSTGYFIRSSDLVGFSSFAFNSKVFYQVICSC